MENLRSLPLGTVLTDQNGTQYTVERVLGQGGFGITYLVVAEMTVNNVRAEVRFAMKELFPAHLCDRDPETLAVRYAAPAAAEFSLHRSNFTTEARRLVDLGDAHPNIVTANNVFEANGTVYYVMEYIDGQTLTEYVAQRGPLPEEETLGIFLPVVEAVAFLHERKLNHLDIKPDNIIMAHARTTGSVRPVLIDFGMAKHYDQKGDVTTPIRGLGYTPGYASEEQERGLISHFSPTADVYSLGATLLFCLTAKIPDDPYTIRCQGLALPEGLSEPVNNAISSSMAERPADRPADAGVLYGLLSDGKNPTVPVTPKQTYTPAPTVPSVPPTPPAAPIAPTSPVAPVRKKNRWLVPALAVLAVVVIAAVATFFALRSGSDVLELTSNGETIELQPNTPKANTLVVSLPEGGSERYYVTAETWAGLSPAEKAKVTPLGLYLGDGTILSLTGSGDQTWNDAPKESLPTRQQAEYILSHFDEIQYLLKTFGGEPFDPSGAIWTSEAYDDANAWGLVFPLRELKRGEKDSTTGVREIVK